MSYSPSIEELRVLTRGMPMAHPLVRAEARERLGSALLVVEEIGLPANIADWFTAVREIPPCPAVEGHLYRRHGEELPLICPFQIGEFEFGVHVVDASTGCVVYVDEDGSTQLINTSVERFLYFAGWFWQSDDRRFADAK